MIRHYGGYSNDKNIITLPIMGNALPNRCQCNVHDSQPGMAVGVCYKWNDSYAVRADALCPTNCYNFQSRKTFQTITGGVNK